MKLLTQTIASNKKEKTTELVNALHRNYQEKNNLCQQVIHSKIFPQGYPKERRIRDARNYLIENLAGRLPE